MAGSPSARSKAFVSYNHADIDHLKRLHVHLEHYKREQKLDIWDDTRITPGTVWKEEIKQAIASAKVAILLVSADFLASEFIAHDELPPLLEAAERDGLIIFLVILSHCAFQRSKLAKYQALNNPSQPLISTQYWQQEEIWAKLAEQVADALRPVVSPPPFVPNTQPFYTKEAECWECFGHGTRRVGVTSYSVGRTVECSKCNGSGKIRVPLGYRDESKWFSIKRSVICQSCSWKNKYDTGTYGNDPLPTHCAGCGAVFE